MTINIEHSNLFAPEIYEIGRGVEQREHAEKEAKALGNLRGGSSGCVTPQGEIYGTCHRKSLARLLGHQTKIEPISYQWFDAGFANEDAWERKFRKAMQDMGAGYNVKFEEECPVKWENDYGVAVTGRPDLMVFRDEKPILGLELKVVCAVNSAVNVYCEEKPKINNLIQAAHYSMIHGCPFSLVYSWRSRARVPGWAERHKEKLNLTYEKTFTNAKTGKSFTRREYSIDPFVKEFRLGFDNDRVYYVTESGKRVDTPLTAQGIRDYYNLISRMKDEKTLVQRISSLDLAGNQLPYDTCKYCEFSEACNQFEFDYDAWVDKVKLICEGE